MNNQNNKQVQLYDWVPFFHELAGKLIELHKDSPDEDVLRPVAERVFAQGDDKTPAILRYPEIPIDPFSFLNAVANKGNNNDEFMLQVQDIFGIKNSIPSDRIYPIGNSRNLLFHTPSNEAMDIDELWELFELLYNYSGEMETQRIQELFEKIQNISGVKLAKCSQVMTLINGYEFLPIDQHAVGKRVALHNQIIFNNETLPQEGETITFDRYQRLLQELRNCFKGSAMYDIQRLMYLISTGNIQPQIDAPWFQILCRKYDSEGRQWRKSDASNVHISDGDDYINDWLENNYVALDSNPKEGNKDASKTLAAREPGTLIIAKCGTGTFHGLGIIPPESPLRTNEDGNPSRQVMWLLRDKQTMHGLTPHVLSQTNSTSEVFNSLKEKYPTLWNYLESFSEANSKEQEVNQEKPTYAAPSPHPLNRILYGPPGTGKTYNTIRVAAEIISGESIEQSEAGFAEAREIFNKHRASNAEQSDAFASDESTEDASADQASSRGQSGRIEFVTFHPSYSYEDFVQGLRPVLKKEDGGASDSASGLRFTRADGVLLRIAKRAKKDMKNSYVIIIDEINRANISRVFGELITLIEEDKREGKVNELSCTLPSGEVFSLPPNLYIIGTMNTADKSIALVDIALRRRFTFEAMYPQYEVPGYTIHDADKLKAMNKEIIKAKGEQGYDLQIGHSYFMTSGSGDYNREDTMNNKVIPLLLEYFRNDSEAVKNILSKGGFEIAKADDETPVWPLRITSSNEESS